MLTDGALSGEHHSNTGLRPALTCRALSGLNQIKTFSKLAILKGLNLNRPVWNTGTYEMRGRMKYGGV